MRVLALTKQSSSSPAHLLVKVWVSVQPLCFYLLIYSLIFLRKKQLAVV